MRYHSLISHLLCDFVSNAKRSASVGNAPLFFMYIHANIPAVSTAKAPGTPSRNDAVMLIAFSPT